MKLKAFAILATLGSLSACVDEPPGDTFVVKDYAPQWVDAPCATSNPNGNAYFGDLHVHTALSNDAYAFDVRVDPDQAYQYAFGKEVFLPPLDAEGNSTRPVKIDRPLDFMGVTDHAEFLGEQTLCLDPDSGVADASGCDAFREGNGRSPSLVMKISLPWSGRDTDICGENGERCRDALKEPWEQVINAAQKWDDNTPDCQRTTFIAYEHSSFRQGSNLHRNVIFKNTSVLTQPISFIDRHREWGLWETLKETCIDSGTGCDVIAIPHNSNISNGRMFSVDYPDTNSVKEQAARAKLRMQIEPIVEIMQHKGDSECRNGLPGVAGGNDELCDFEKFENLTLSLKSDEPPEACVGAPWADLAFRLGPSCLDKNSYVRYALISGLQEQDRIGVNPFKFGITASTDTHNGLGGGVEEKSFPGHLGKADDEVLKRATYSNEYAGNASNNPGGLIGVWAPENSRTALFDAMRKKEVFGTSGPRIEPRFFGGYGFDQNLCNDPQMITKAYQQGVAMGQDLPQGQGAPSFLVSAMADAGTAQYPGMPLQRLQIIKGWADADGMQQQRVYDVAGDANNGASVNPDTCEVSGTGFSQLCSVWQDPEFDENQSAVYYARAVENPTCRFNAWQCATAPEGERPAVCDESGADKIIQERAWTSPIWYTAASG